MPKLIFITHPDVVVDPSRPIPDWGLNPLGRARAELFARTPLLAEVSSIWSSTERKATETAEILAAFRDLPTKTRQDLGENDRSATGFLPRDAFEAAADAFFAAPDTSFHGWERAVDAQNRIVAATHAVVRQHATGDLAIVSHGAVGTLLWCRLKGLPISRLHDQPSQGHYWCAELDALRPETGWCSIG